MPRDKLQGVTGEVEVPQLPGMAGHEEFLRDGVSAESISASPENWRNFWRQAVSHLSRITYEANQKTKVT